MHPFSKAFIYLSMFLGALTTSFASHQFSISEEFSHIDFEYSGCSTEIWTVGESYLFLAELGALNDFIIQNINNGKLKDKKFDFNLLQNGCGFGDQLKGMELIQTDSSYQINLQYGVMRVADLNFLKRAVNYFVQKKKMTFKVEKTTWDTLHGSILSMLTAKLDEAGVLEIAPETIIIKTNGDMSTKFVNGKIKVCYQDEIIPGNYLDYDIYQFKNRYFLIVCNQVEKLMIMENGKTISEHPINAPYERTPNDCWLAHGIDIKTEGNELKIMWGEDIHFTYSYETNEFFKVE